MRIAVALIILAAGIGPAAADPLPLPRTDFVAKGDAQGFTFVYRYHDGKLRIDQKLAGAALDSTSIVTLATGKAIVIAAGTGTALELSADDVPFKLNPGALEGKRIGAATVAGEACDQWEVNVPTTKAAETLGVPGKVVYCITRDGITLRTEYARPDGRPFTITASEVARTAQDPKLFEPPAGVKVTRTPDILKKLPSGLLGKVLSNH